MINERGVVILKEDLCGKWLDIMKECGLNVLGLHVLDTPGSIENYLGWLAGPDVQNLLGEFERAGIRVEHELHAMSYLLPRSEFTAAPEMFRLEGGKRVENTNYCTSDKRAGAMVADRAAALAKALSPTSHRYYLWQDDHGFNKPCECEKCAGLSALDQEVVMMNNILRGLRRVDGEARLAFLKYDDIHALPSAAPDEGIFLEFAPYARNHAVPLNDGSDAKNAAFVRELGELSKKFDMTKAHILEYFLDVSFFSGWKRENITRLDLDTRRVKADVDFYSSLGVKFITTFAAFMDEECLTKYGYDSVKRYAEILSSAK